MTSLLKAWRGPEATEDNDHCFDYLPRIDGDHSAYDALLRMDDGEVEGYFVMGENPVIGAANGNLWRKALGKLSWLVVRDLVEVETASFWRDQPDCETEVFFLPASAHVEKNGSFTNTQRLLQWHHQAVEPPGDCRSELWFMYHLGRRVREKLGGSTDPRDRGGPRPDLGLADEGGDGRARRRGRAARDQRHGRRREGAGRLHRPARRRLDHVGLLDLLRLLRRRGQPAGAAAPGIRADVDRAGMGLGVAGEPPHPLQPLLGRPAGPAVVGAQAP